MNKLLVANRGEIALRIMRTAKSMGISTVSIFSESDKDSWHRKVADESVYVGNSPPKESYLNMEKILEAAINTGADFVHPGYGFLSENAKFIELLEEVD